MKMRSLMIPLSTLLMLSCGGQMAMPGSSTKSDIEELQKRVLELQRRAAVNEIELGQLRGQVAALRQGGAAPMPSPQASGPAKEENAAWEAPMRTAEIESSDLPAIAAPPPAAPTPASGDDLNPQPPPSSEAQALYDRGYTLYHQGRYEDAEKIFREYLVTYRMNELSDNAWYWIAESRWARGNVTGALDAFRETLENFPRGNKTPDALLKMGQCLERLGDLEDARETYRQLVERYPATAAAVVAQDRLAGSG